MAEYNLGNAHGRIIIDSDTSGIGDAERQLGGLNSTAESTSNTMSETGTKVGLAGAAIAGGLGLAVKTAADFEQGLSNIQAVSGATTAQMDKIHDKALQIGADTAFGATEAASAMEELVKAGLSVDDVLGGAADATVALAAAGGVDMPTAATIASNAMNQFGLTAKDMVNTVDLIAGAANASAIDVTDFGMSMGQVGAVANLAGLSFNDTAVAIAEMGNAGIKGSDAGTSLKTMLSNLQPSTKAASAAMEELGIITADGTNQFYDAQGNLKSLGEVQGILQNATKDLSAAQKQQALQTIFGSDAIRAAAVLSKEGAAGYETMNASMLKTSAADVAKTRMDNLNGTIENFKGGVETAAITIGEQLIPLLKSLTNGLGALFDWFNSLSPAQQSLITGFLTAAAATLLVAGAIMKSVKVIKSFREAFSVLNTVMRANPMLAIISVIILLITWFVTAYATSETFRDKVNGAMRAVGKVVGAVVDAMVSAFEWVKDKVEAVGAWFAGPFLDFFKSVGTFLKNWGPLILAVIAPFIGIPLLIAQHWDKIVDFFQALPGRVGRFLSALATKVGHAFVAAWDAVVDAVETAGEAVLDELKALPGQIVYLLGYLAGLVVRGAITAFWGLVDGAKAAGKAVWEELLALPGQVWNILTTLAGMVKDGAVAAWSWLSQAAVDEWNKLYAMFTAMPGQVWDLLVSMATAVKNGATAAWGWLTSTATTAFDETVAWVTALPGRIKTALVNLAVYLLTVATDAWNSFQGGVETGGENTLTWFQALPGKVLSSLGDAGSWLLSAGGDVLLGLWHGIEAGWAAFWGFVTGLWGKFIQGFKDAMGISSPSSVFAQFGQWILQGLWNGLQAMWGSVTGMLSNIITSIIGSFSAAGSWLYNAGVWLLQGLGNGIRALMGWIHDVEMSVINGITGAFSGAGSWLLNAGSDLVRGLWNGISNMTSWVLSKIRGFGSSVINGIKSFFGIGSPSKLLADEVGKWLPPGIAVGIDANADAALKAARQLAEGVTGSLALSSGGPDAFWDASSLGVGSVPPSSEVAAYAASQGDAATTDGNTYNFNTYNPVAERASDSEARRLRALSALGAF